MAPHTAADQALQAAGEALKLARRELSHVDTAPDSWRWVAVGLVSALQGALVAALQSYETAVPEDVSDPAWPERYAPVALLLRRARSTKYLNAPERLDMPGAMERSIERLLSFRNDVLHAVHPEIPERIGPDCCHLTSLLQHLLVNHPAFNPDAHVFSHVVICDQLTAIERALGAFG